MPAPSPLKIATSAVTRLVKEEEYYQKELSSQTARVQKLEENLKNSATPAESNAEFMLKQEVSLAALFGPSFFGPGARRTHDEFG
jgi:tubulin-specific chaperone A